MPPKKPRAPKKAPALKPLASLPSFDLASKRGRKCIRCAERKVYAAFRAFTLRESDALERKFGPDRARVLARPGTSRVCLDCRLAGIQKKYRKKCVVCSDWFESNSQRAGVCGFDCAVVQIARTRKARSAAQGSPSATDRKPQ